MEALATTRHAGGVSPAQRFTRDDRCPVCDGWQSGGHGEHCYGMWSDDRTTAFCSEIPNDSGVPSGPLNTYPHRITGGEAADNNRSSSHPAPVPRRKRVRYPGIRSLLADGWHETARYPYEYPDGTLHHYEVRYDPPTPDAGRKRHLPWQQLEDGSWVMDLQGLAPILYRLPELLTAPAHRPVFIVEGPKCVEALRSIGLLATCNEGGADVEGAKWRCTEGRQEALHDRHTICLPDNDPERPDKPHESRKGQRFVQAIAADLAGVAKTVRIVELPGLPEKGDIVDWLADGHTKDELLELALTTMPIATCADGGEAERIRVLELRVREFEQREERDKRKAELRGVWDIPNEAFDPAEKRTLSAMLEMAEDEIRRGRVSDGGEVRLSVGYVRKRDTGEIVGPGIEGTAKLPKRTIENHQKRFLAAGLFTVRNEQVRGRGGKIESSANYYTFNRGLIAEMIAHPRRAVAIMAAQGVPLHKRGGDHRTCPMCGSERVKVMRRVSYCACAECRHTWEEIKGGEDDTLEALEPENMGTSPMRQNGTPAETDLDIDIVRQTGASVEPAFDAPSQLTELHQHCADCGSTRTYRFVDDDPAMVRCWDCDPLPLHTTPAAPAVSRPAPESSCQKNPDGGWHEYARMRNAKYQLLCIHCWQPEPGPEGQASA